MLIIQPPVVGRVDNDIHWINLYPVNSALRFVNSSPLDSGEELTKGEGAGAGGSKRDGNCEQ